MEIIEDGKIYKIKCPKCKCTFGYSEKDKYKVFVKETVQFTLTNYYIILIMIILNVQNVKIILKYKRRKLI